MNHILFPINIDFDITAVISVLKIYVCFFIFDLFCDNGVLRAMIFHIMLLYCLIIDVITYKHGKVQR